MKRIFSLVFIILTVISVGSNANSAPAGASDWFVTDQNKVRLIGSVAAEDAAVSYAGIEFALKDHWHVYWRSPGDAGLPPEFDWSQSQNIQSVEFLWPYPKAFDFEGLTSFGYSDHVIFPLKVTKADPHQPAILAGKLDYLICADICIPHQTDLSMTLATEQTEFSDKIKTALENIPSMPTEQFKINEAVLQDTQSVQVTLIAPTQPTLFAETADDIIIDSITESPSSPGVWTYTIHIKSAARGLAGDNLTLTAVAGGKAIEQSVEIKASTSASETDIFNDVGPSIAWILLLAFLGGLILNIMPCVLPVLSLKLLKVVGQSGRELDEIRKSFLWVVAGILVSFLVLAIAAISLKEAGESIGWGIQFQSPTFLSFMIVLLLLFGASLWGLFEITLPSALASRLAGSSFGESHLGQFLTGAFATLLATPCTAPFLGTAIGFAVTASSGVILLIFLSIALGFSVPYLLIAYRPQLIKWLPKPGMWMVYVKQILAVLLGLTAAWLIWVMSMQISAPQMLVFASLLAIGAGLIGIYPLFRQALRPLIIIAFIINLGFVFILPTRAEKDPAVVTSALWQPFMPEDIAELVANDRIVFVDLTADWCLTCKFNKLVALDKPEVIQWFGQHDVVAMQGDWTNPDPKIEAYLKQYKRAGIPFNIVFGPKNKEGMVLPEILTTRRVIEALEAVSGVE